jgi:hypothetical protein
LYCDGEIAGQRLKYEYKLKSADVSNYRGRMTND